MHMLTDNTYISLHTHIYTLSNNKHPFTHTYLSDTKRERREGRVERGRERRGDRQRGEREILNLTRKHYTT